MYFLHLAEVSVCYLLLKKNLEVFIHFQGSGIIYKVLRLSGLGRLGRIHLWNDQVLCIFVRWILNNCLHFFLWKLVKFSNSKGATLGNIYFPRKLSIYCRFSNLLPRGQQNNLLRLLNFFCLKGYFPLVISHSTYLY